jgi:transcriptional regulator with XRE-family HTH domain
MVTMVVSIMISSIKRATLMTKLTEQEHFSQRLKQALLDSGYATISSAVFAREFNLRFPNLRITPHAARKWVMGESIPTQERLVSLARWLGVSPEWLRFDGSLEPGSTNPLNLLTDLRLLDAPHRKFIYETVRTLVHVVKENETLEKQGKQ